MFSNTTFGTLAKTDVMNRDFAELIL